MNISSSNATNIDYKRGEGGDHKIQLSGRRKNGQERLKNSPKTMSDELPELGIIFLEHGA
jgi:hypothetical protein